MAKKSKTEIAAELLPIAMEQFRDIVDECIDIALKRVENGGAEKEEAVKIACSMVTALSEKYSQGASDLSEEFFRGMATALAADKIETMLRRRRRKQRVEKVKKGEADD